MSGPGGAWKPLIDRGYNAHKRPWIIRRYNPLWFGCQQTLAGASGTERRFASEEKAQKVADELNKKEGSK